MKIRLLLGVMLLTAGWSWGATPRTIEVLAAKDNMFKVTGQKSPVIRVKAGEVITLKITAQQGQEHDKDGAVHSFTVKEFKDQGWDIRLMPGTHEYTLVAPSEPGEYVIECTVKCGDGHDDMKAKLIVTP